MRLRIRHTLTARFDEPVSLVQRSLRMSPRTFNGQYVRAWRIEVDHDCRQNRSTDAFGNTTHEFTLTGAIRAVSIVAAGEVEVDDTAGVLKGTLGDRMPPAVYLRETPATALDADIRALARAARTGSDGNDLDACHRLMHLMHERIEPQPASLDERVNVGGATAAACLAAGQGTPAAIAHLFVAAARSLLIPARYVSGYICRGSDRDAGDAAHAWAEALIPGLGWVGFDAENDTCPTDAYIRVASALDQSGGAFVRGADRGGPPTLEVAITAEPLAV